MTEDEIAQKLFSDPDGFFDLLEKSNIDISDLKMLDIPRLFVRERYKELIKQEYFEAAEAVFWISYFAEREIRDDILSIETELGKNAKEIEDMLDGMTFREKIQFIVGHYCQGKYDDYIKVLQSIKKLRNHMAHGRLDKLIYGRYSMADPRGQMKITIDLMNAARKK